MGEEKVISFLTEYATDLEIPEPLKELYKKTDDGKFVLHAVSKAKHNEFREKNVRLMKEIAAAQDKIKDIQTSIDLDEILKNRFKQFEVDLDEILKNRFKQFKIDSASAFALKLGSFQMKTFQGEDGATYLVFRIGDSYHVFTEVEAKDAALNCGSKLNREEITRKHWDELWHNLL